MEHTSCPSRAVRLARSSVHLVQSPSPRSLQLVRTTRGTSPRETSTQNPHLQQPRNVNSPTSRTLPPNHRRKARPSRPSLRAVLCASQSHLLPLLPSPPTPSQRLTRSVSTFYRYLLAGTEPFLGQSQRRSAAQKGQGPNTKGFHLTDRRSVQRKGSDTLA